MNGCFGCDAGNAAGLGISFYRAASGRLAARWRPDERHRGLGRLVHGALLGAFGEELAALEAGSKGDGGLLAAEMNVRFERPAPVGAELTALVTHSEQKGRRVVVTVEVASGGERVAVVSSTFVLVSAERLQEVSGMKPDQAPACLVAARGELPVGP